MSRPIAGKAFLSALQAAGIVDGNVHRVVVDAPADGFVRVYTEGAGDERLLTVTSTLDGVEIRWE